MAEIRQSGTWGSALTSDEFAAIRSVGFDSVGQVLGAAVYNVGYTGGYNCPGGWAGYGRWGPAPTPGTQVSSQGGYGSFGPLVQTMYQARRAAIGRMTAECAELGGHGVVGVRLSIGPFPSGGLFPRRVGAEQVLAGTCCVGRLNGQVPGAEPPLLAGPFFVWVCHAH